MIPLIVILATFLVNYCHAAEIKNPIKIETDIIEGSYELCDNPEYIALKMAEGIDGEGHNIFKVYKYDPSYPTEIFSLNSK